MICFTDTYHYHAWKALADRLGVYFDEATNDRLRGVSRMASLEIILKRSDREYTRAEKEALTEEKNAAYRISSLSNFFDNPTICKTEITVFVL